MKICKLDDLQKLVDSGGAFLNIINGDEFGCWIPAEKTMKRLHEYLDALIKRLENKENQKYLNTIEQLSAIQRPFDIWFYRWEKESEAKSFWTGNRVIKKEKKVSYYFVFHKQLTREEIVNWNMWIMGYFTRVYR